MAMLLRSVVSKIFLIFGLSGIIYFPLIALCSLNYFSPFSYTPKIWYNSLMENKNRTRPVTHKTDYEKSRYVLTPIGICEFLGYHSLTLIARIPGTYDCFSFSPADVSFYPSSGKSLLYYERSTGRYFSAEVLETYFADGVLRFKICIHDSRWNNPVSVFVVSKDDLDF